MPEKIEKCECINPLDKSLMVRITKIAIDKEIDEIKKIEEKGKQLLSKPEELKSFIRIRSSLIQEHSILKDNIQKLKEKIDNTPECRHL